MGTVSAQSLPRDVGKVKGYVHDDALCTGKALADAGRPLTVAAGVRACTVTPLWDQGAFLPGPVTM